MITKISLQKTLFRTPQALDTLITKINDLDLNDCILSKLNYFDDSQITLAIERLNFKKKEEFVDLYETKLLMPIHERYRDRHIHVIRRFVLAIARHRPLLVSEKLKEEIDDAIKNEYPFGYPKFFATLNIILFSATLGLSKLIPILIRDIFSLKKTGRLHPLHFR